MVDCLFLFCLLAYLCSLNFECGVVESKSLVLCDLTQTYILGDKDF